MEIQASGARWKYLDSGLCKGAARIRRPDQPLIYAAFGPLISADQSYAVSVNQRLLCDETSPRRH